MRSVRKRRAHRISKLRGGRNHNRVTACRRLTKPRDLKQGAVFIEGSILDRPKLTDIFRGCDCIVHIAAWHGIHEDRGEKVVGTGPVRQQYPLAISGSMTKTG
jgi:nucleoside-diphosphate-sugar epimerase